MGHRRKVRRDEAAAGVSQGCVALGLFLLRWPQAVEEDPPPQCFAASNPGLLRRVPFRTFVSQLQFLGARWQEEVATRQDRRAFVGGYSDWSRALQLGIFTCVLVASL